MAVAVDGTGTAAATGGAATSFTSGAGSVLTIGSGANRVLILSIQWGANPGTITSVKWDTAGANLTLTQIGSTIAESDNLGYCALFGLINPPTTIQKQWSATWANSVDWTTGAMSFTGADQGSVAGTFRNIVSGNPASTTALFYPPPSGVNINSASGDYCVISAASNNNSFGAAVQGANVRLYALNTNVSGSAVYTAGAGASTGIALALITPTANPACYIGCDIAAVGTVGVAEYALKRRVRNLYFR